MNFLKIIGIVIGTLFLLALLIAIVSKKDYTAERFVNIAKPKSSVFDFLKLLKNQDSFSKWGRLDPNMAKSYKGTDGTVGFIASWDSKNRDVGTGEQEIKNIQEGSRIDYELRFIKPIAGVSQAWMTTENISETETKVKWGFSGRMAWPMNIILLFVDMEELLGKDFQMGLDKLKSILESQV